jgi:predicted SprT family Zn-dependent metalloprotease
MNIRYTVHQIYEMAGEMTFYNNKLKVFVADALSKIPAEAVDYLMKSCLIHALEPDLKGQYVPKRHIPDRDIIFISDRYLCTEKEEEAVIGTILHECAHCYLKHKSLLDGRPYDFENQDKEADDLVNNWLNRH